VALEAAGGELLDALVGVADETLRLEDAITVASKRRLVALLVGAEPEQAQIAIDRLVRAARTAVPEGRLRAATRLASPEVGADWKGLFAELAPLDEPPAPEQGS
jgi:hypothetical protein